jgi:hypothetical protein
MTDDELISQALSMWANWIETHDVNSSRNDLLARYDLPIPGIARLSTLLPKREIRQLTTEQLSLVARIRQLSERTGCSRK